MTSINVPMRSREILQKRNDCKWLVGQDPDYLLFSRNMKPNTKFVKIIVCIDYYINITPERKKTKKV